MTARAIAAALLALAPLAAAAQTLQETPVRPSGREATKPAPFLGGVSAVEFIRDRDVYGALSEDIGEVADLVVGPDNRVVSVIAVIERFLDIGESYVSVPVELIEGGMIGGRPAIRIPITDEDDMFDYPLFGGPERPGGLAREIRPVDAEPILPGGLWRVSEQIGRPVRVIGEDGDLAGFGLVDDFILSENEVVAVIVTPDVSVGAGGPRGFAVQAFGGGWNPAKGEYRLPLTADAALAEPRIDRATLGN